MPCLCDDNKSSGDYYTEGLRKDIANLEASLCAALTYIAHGPSDVSYDNFIRNTDWAEAGISPKKVDSWWQDHQKKDNKRKEEENKKKLALSKLTPEDKKVLGLR